MFISREEEKRIINRMKRDHNETLPVELVELITRYLKAVILPDCGRFFTTTPKLFGEIRQETFLRLLKNIRSGKYNPDICKVTTYSVAIAINILRELMRKNPVSRYPKFSEESEKEMEPVKENQRTPSELAIFREQKDVLIKAISILPVKDRFIFCCRRGFWPFKNTFVSFKPLSISDLQKFLTPPGRKLISKGWINKRNRKAFNKVARELRRRGIRDL